MYLPGQTYDSINEGVRMNYETYRTVIHTDLLTGMIPSGEWDIPSILPTNACPKMLIPFDKAMSANTLMELALIVR